MMFHRNMKAMVHSVDGGTDFFNIIAVVWISEMKLDDFYH